MSTRRPPHPGLGWTAFYARDMHNNQFARDMARMTFMADRILAHPDADLLPAPGSGIGVSIYDLPPTAGWPPDKAAGLLAAWRRARAGAGD